MSITQGTTGMRRRSIQHLSTSLKSVQIHLINRASVAPSPATPKRPRRVFLMVASGSSTLKNSTKPSWFKIFKKKIQISTDYCAMTTVMQPHLSTAVLCHPFINHNLPKSCFSIANLSGKTAGMRRSLFLLALLSSLDHTPLGADTQLPQRPPGWWSDPSLWYHLQTGFWQQSWWKSNHPVCFLMKVCWSYL